jgi:hypothetical protein
MDLGFERRAWTLIYACLGLVEGGTAAVMVRALFGDQAPSLAVDLIVALVGLAMGWLVGQPGPWWRLAFLVGAGLGSSARCHFANSACDGRQTCSRPNATECARGQPSGTAVCANCWPAIHSFASTSSPWRCSARGAILLGVSSAAGSLGWTLAHNEFAPRGEETRYMALHVTLTGMRGLIAPPLTVGAYHALEAWRAGLGPATLGIPLSLVASGAWRFHRMRRTQLAQAPA